MRLIRDLSLCPAECQGAAVALGNFDGVHRGHRTILDETIAIAKANHCPSAVMTFEPHPREFFSKNPGSLRLYPLRQKLRLLQDSGVDIIFLMRFNTEFSTTSAQNFINDILYKKLRVRHVITGQNFFFGQNRQGNRELLAAEAHRLEFGFTAHPPVYDDNGEFISSSAIRKQLAEGDIMSASAMLGRPYVIEGHVVRGQQRGLGFPTANVPLIKLFKPRFGIYAARARIDGDANYYDGAANLGINPTFGGQEALLEAHLFDMNRELYGKKIVVELIRFMRDEQMFLDLDSLKKQIAIDCEKAKSILAEHP